MSFYLNFYEFMCIYEAKHDKKMQPTFLTTVFNASEFIFLRN
jgi:hypothetical protein